ncbi:TPA: conjugal transfer protein TraR [Salmonella enterica]|uniref:DUF6750 family protein n=1 Tax=Enterobacter roggenkampii TaxID=1812935 RepID=UPI00198AE1C6|nr:conjugal transfer protein TraR [Salmonella enterica subsp. enterica serovar Orion]HAK7475005.1 conjugal transfer protein TraR [Salmonella enterica]EJR7832919.1 conjugal transfer protein TraR [Salmonella enterica subsp. enterica serovar Orion]HAK8236180.1 conjugal transfer protein TraR [Salmonella enterica]HAK8531589.1 conjugal transfer protein TraR [Salmonella enterica]
MSLFRALTARLYAVVFYIQLTLIALRERAVRALLALIAGLLPGIALADGDLADMFDSAAAGAKRAKTSGLDIFQMLGLFIFGASLLAFKKVGSHPQVTLGRCVAGLLIGAGLFIIPELISRSQKQMGTSSITIN